MTTPNPSWVSKPHLSGIEPVGEGFDLRRIVALLRLNAVWIGALMGICLITGVIATLLQTRQYTANASVQIDDAAAQVIRGAEDTQPSSSFYDTDRFLNTQLDVLRSRSLAKRVVDRLKLSSNARYLAALGGSSLPSSASRKQVEEAAAKLVRSHMFVALPRQSRVATISVVSADSQVSADIANAYANEFIQANLQRKFDSSDYARSFLSDQLAGAKTKLEESERALNAYARQAGLIRTHDAVADGKDGSAGSGDISITAASLVQLNASANTARQDRIAAEARWRAVSGGSALSSREVLSNMTVQNLLTKKAETEAKLREERARHLDDHPDVIRLGAQLDAISQQLDTVIAGVRNSVRQEYQAALTAEQALNAQVTALKGATLNEQDRSVSYGILAREADTNRTLYDGLLQRYKELTAAAGISNSNIALIDQAQVPTVPSSPRLLINLAYALFAGLALSAILVVIRLHLDDGIRIPEDIESKLQLPVLGVIPKRDAILPAEELSDPKSLISEAYNSLRGAISFSTADGAPHLLLVTSASAGEGKSTTSYALARGFAKLGRKVLLVDVDLRRPSTHRQFDVENERGLSNVLVGQNSFDEVVRKSGFDHLSFLTSGPIPPSPTELLASPRMQAFLDDVRKRFDLVILDSPPILGLADSPMVSSLADGTLLVLESDRNGRGILRGALQRMNLARGHVVGAVLTKFDSSHASNYAYYYYGYDYYSYGSRDRPSERRKLFDLIPGRRAEPEVHEDA